MNNKFAKVILSILGCISGCAILAFIVYICWESPNPPEETKSEYDMQYIAADNFVELSSTNLHDLQDEVLEYVSFFKEVKELKCIQIRFDKGLDIEKCTFSYTLDDIEGYYGIFEVICGKEENWIIKSAEVSYYEGVSPAEECYYDNEDTKLHEKIEKIITFIQQNSWYAFDRYSIEIFNEDVYLSGHEKIEEPEKVIYGKVWRVHFNVSKHGEMIFIDEANRGKDEIEEKICLEIKDGMKVEQFEEKVDKFGEGHGSIKICMQYDLQQIKEMVAARYGDNYINTEYMNLYKHEDSELWNEMWEQNINAYYFKLVSGEIAKTNCVEIYVVSDNYDNYYLYVFY